MAKKKEVIDKNVEEIKKNLKAEKAILGAKQTLKELKLGDIAKIFFAKNCSNEIKDEIQYNANISKVETILLNYSNEELGFICKKGYSISVLAIAKGAS